MNERKKILAINGSASRGSSNERLMRKVRALMQDQAEFLYIDELRHLPHFDPALSINSAPPEVEDIRNRIERADGVLICTPEYVFSIPSGLKNMVEWCVSTTIFTDKPVGIITASAHGQKGHEELQLIMRTVMARFNEDTCLLIQGIRGKVDDQGMITDAGTEAELKRFAAALLSLMGDSK